MRAATAAAAALQRAARQCHVSLEALTSAAGGCSLPTSFLSLRAFASSAAASCSNKIQPVACRLQPSSASALRQQPMGFAAAAAAASPAAAAAALRQPARGYARYLQFQPRGGGGGWGSDRWGGMDSDKVLWVRLGGERAQRAHTVAPCCQRSPRRCLLRHVACDSTCALPLAYLTYHQRIPDPADQGLIGANVAGFCLWRIKPHQVRS